MGFTDIHTHCVYGVDDGAREAKDMRAMLDEANRQGVTRIFATSHAEPGMRAFDEAAYQAHLEEGRQYCAEMGYDITLESGAELLYTPAMDAFIQERKLITLGESNDVLVEFVPDVAAKEIQWMLQQMADRGYHTILAHIERYRCMKGSFPFRLKKEFDVQYQVNCGTVIEPRGFLEKRRIAKWFKSGIIDYVATDMHNSTSRPPRMAKAYEVLRKQYGRAAAERLTKAAAMEQ